MPMNPAELLIYRTLVFTWPLYALGALYVVGPVLAWLLGGQTWAGWIQYLSHIQR
jgi:hypothetical protein